MPAAGSRKARKQRAVTPPKSFASPGSGADGLPGDEGSEEDSALRQAAAMTVVSASAAAAAAVDTLPLSVPAADPKTVWAEGTPNASAEGNRRDDNGSGDREGFGGRTGAAALPGATEAAGAVQSNGEAPRAVVAAAASTAAPAGKAAGGGWTAGSFAVPIVGGRSAEAMRVGAGVGAGHGSVIAAGTVSAATER